VCCKVGDVELRVAGKPPEPGVAMAVMVRPERVEVARGGAAMDGANVLPGRVGTLTFRGAHTAVLLDCAGLRLEAEVANVAGAPPEWLTEGAQVTAQVSPQALRLLTA
jgi:ABC-type molybdate transport system ATPase subunit